MSYRRIVIGVDFATASLTAVRWVASNFGRRAKLLLVHVAPDPRRPEFLKQHLPESETAHAVSAAYQGLRSVANLAGAGRSDVDILTGSPAEGLALAAEEFDADLVCVGKSRRRRGAGRFGATTPERLLGRTSLPVLVVPDNARSQPVSVLAAVNDGPEGARVLQSASRLAVAWDARVDVLHVVEAEPPSHAPAELTGARLVSMAKQWLIDRVASLAMRPERVMPIARLGDAGAETVGHAVRSDTGLIVLGRGSHDASNGVEMPGSTTRLAAWVAPCPVLVLGAHSAKTHRRITRDGWRDLASHREANVRATTKSAATQLQSSTRPSPDGGDAA
jgi:nucleotide-binding universal stress UspA family protein